MGWREDDYYFERTEALAREAMKEGDDGFACVLVGPMGDILWNRKMRPAPRRIRLPTM